MRTALRWLLGDIAVVWLQLACVRVQHDLEVGETLNDVGLDDRAAHGRVLPVVVEGVDECTHPGSALEVASVLARPRFTKSRYHYHQLLTRLPIKQSFKRIPDVIQ